VTFSALSAESLSTIISPQCVYVSGGSKSFVLRKNEAHGTINYFATLHWLHKHGMLTLLDRLSQFKLWLGDLRNRRVARTFTVHSLTLHLKF
jgi:hypothetical protein